MNQVFALAVVILLAACASPYQPEGFGGGYSETQLSENIFKVSFRGNGYTSEDRAADMALLRSAELALENGFKYFAVVDEQIRFSTVPTPCPRQQLLRLPVTAIPHTAPLPLMVAKRFSSRSQGQQISLRVSSRNLTVLLSLMHSL